MHFGAKRIGTHVSLHLASQRQSLGKGVSTMEAVHPTETRSPCPSAVQRAESCKEEHLGRLEGVWGTPERMEMGDILKHWVEGEM